MYASSPTRRRVGSFMLHHGRMWTLLVLLLLLLLMRVDLMSLHMMMRHAHLLVLLVVREGLAGVLEWVLMG